MDARCVYTVVIDGKEVSMNLKELTEHYYKTTDLLKRSRIFSSEETQLAAIEQITKNVKSKESLKAENITLVRDFATKEQPQLIRELGLSEQDRLVPEYVESNRIIKYIEDKINTGEEPILDSKEHPELNKYMQLDSLSRYTKEKVNHYLKEITELIKFDKKTMIVARDLHGILVAVSKYNGNFDHPIVEKALESFYENNQEILEGDKRIWKKVLISTLDRVHTYLKNRGTILSSVSLLSEQGITDLGTTIDSIVVDSNGDSHIFDLKVSKKSFDQWDISKIQETDWILALNRQLLGQYTEIKNTSLNIIPIELGDFTNGKLNPENLGFSTVQIRTADQPTLWESGKLKKIAKKIVPETLFASYDPLRKKELLTDLEVLLPGYTVKTAKEETDIEKLVEKAKKTGKWYYYNKYELPEMPKGSIVIKDIDSEGRTKTTEQKEKEFRKKVTPVLARVLEDAAKNVSVLREKITSAIADPDNKILTSKNTEQKALVNNVLKDFIHGTYRVVKDTQEMTSLGFIVLENTKNGKLSVINISAHGQKASFDEDLIYEEVEYIKTFAFLNRFYNELGLNRTEIEEIIILNLDGLQVGGKDVEKMFNKFTELMQVKKLTNKLTHKNITPLLERAWNLVRSSLRTYSGTDRTQVENILKPIWNESFQNISYEKLREIQKSMFEAFPDLVDQTRQPSISFSDQRQYLFAMIQVLLLSKSGQLPEGDFLGMRDFSIGWPDVKSLVASLYSKSQEKYNKEGKKILGVMGSLRLSTPDKIGSIDLQSINKIISLTNSRIRQLMVKQSSKLNGITTEFYDKIGYSKTARNFIGESRSKFKNIWVLDDTGDISIKWQLKNPYENNIDNVMTDAEREYAKKILFEIQKYMLNLKTKDIESIDISTLETIKKTDKSQEILKAIESEEYFKMPLIRSQQLDRYGRALSGGIKGMFQSGRELSNEFEDFIDTRELSKEDLENINKQQKGLYEMPDVYAMQNDESKAEAIRRHKDTVYWELNLDTIAHKVAFTKIRKNLLDHKLPIISAYIWWMKLQSGKKNEDMSKELDYIIDQVTVAALDGPIVDEEFKDPSIVIAAVKKITTIGMLAFRPVLMAKELSIGLLKGFNIAASKVFGKDLFDSRSLTLALEKLGTAKKTFAAEFNLIDRLNHYYGIANMDLNTIAEKMQTDRRGFMKGLSPWMYAMNTIPDYYNRMALLLAKMIYDGSYDAHELVNGELKYNTKKDARFSYYFENRHKYVNDDGNYTPALKDEKYNRQRNLYLLLANQLTIERTGLTDEKFSETILIDQAYIEKERDSFKSLADTAYGYYHKDSQALLHNMAFGITFMQFMQYWPGKMQMWFGKPVSAEISPIGKFAQKFITDDDGNKQLLWREQILDEEGNFTGDFKPTTINTGDPLIEWQGSPQEGLFYALGYTIQDIFRGNFSDIKKDEKERLGKLQFAAIDGLLLVLFWGMIVAMIKGAREDWGEDEVGEDMLKFAEAVSTKVLNEQNVYQNTLGAFSSEPAWLTYSTKVAGDTQDAITGTGSLKNMVGQNFRAFEIWDME
jgi:hypothetical protein